MKKQHGKESDDKASSHAVMEEVCQCSLCLQTREQCDIGFLRLEHGMTDATSRRQKSNSTRSNEPR